MSKKSRRKPGEGEVLTDFASDWLNENLAEDLAVLRGPQPAPPSEEVPPPPVVVEPAPPPPPPVAVVEPPAPAPEPPRPVPPPAPVAEAKPAPAPEPVAAAPVQPTRAGKYLVFRLGKEEYGVDVLKVREIIRMQEITNVPNVARHLKGVINLRGKVVGVMDLRRRFDLPAVDQTNRTCIVVVTKPSGALIGLVVDEVSAVLNVKKDDLEDKPDFGHTVASDYVAAMAKSQGRVKMLLEIDLVTE